VATLHCAAFGRGSSVAQISARTVQSRIAKRTASKNITKAQVRNGVIELMPEVGIDLTQHLMEWDRWDAIAIGLCHLGYRL
jgi:Holliday junction resolvasome RuvABC endonuclease subunit